MKPLYLSFKAFGPYLEKQEIDFTRLADAGIFLISGPTGAGKTTILDAMSYALYDVSSGGGRGEIEAMRCQFAKMNDDTEVELIIEADGRIYKFTRTLRFGRTKFTQTQNVFVKNEEGVFEPIFANPRKSDVNSKAVELIGLSEEQFRRVILLPQGQFEKLLTSKSDEKEAVLVSLFGADKWQKAAQKVYEKAKEAKDKLNSEIQSATFILDKYNCENPDDLISLKETELQKETQLKKTLKLYTDEYDKAQKEYENAKGQDVKYEEYEKASKAYSVLISDREDYDNATKILSMCNSSFEIKPFLDKKDEEKRNLNQRQKERLEISVRLDEEKEAVLKISDEFEALKQKDNEIQKLSDALALMQGLIPMYEDIEKKICAKEQARREANKAKLKYDTLNSECEKKEKEAILKSEALEKTLSDYQKVTEMYIMSISSSLAKELRDGIACPVCGSLTHPSPKIATDETVTQKEKNECEEKLSQCKEEFDRAVSEKEDLVKKRDEANSEYQKLNSEFEKICVQISSFESSQIEDVNTLSELKNRISSYAEIVSSYRENLETKKKEKETKIIECTRLETELKKAIEEESLSNENFKKASVALEKELDLKGFENENEMKKCLLTPDEKMRLIKKTEDYILRSKVLSEKLNSLKDYADLSKRPDIQSYESKVGALSKQREEISNALAVLGEKIANIKNDYTILISKREKFQKDILLADADLLFAKQLRGDTGMGIQRYILAAMLGAVTGEANKLLAEVHGGRYRLNRTSETSDSRTRKSGLELEVFDRISGEKRSVTSLSGGEKFLASLSLSIGLASVVMSQSKGKKLDSMFIDEGFGSLDTQSVADALSVLSHVKKAKGSVGIISHVSTLKECIGTRIEIIKSNGTSKIKIINV